MGKIVISTNSSIDGIVQDPDGKDGFTRGGWFLRSGGGDLKEWGKILQEEALGSAALLLGRRSDEWFATRWTDRTDEWANRLNRLPKYVVSATLDEAKWTNATVLKGDIVSEVAKLRQELTGDIVVYGSYQLGQALMEHDLVDELRLFVYPVVVGSGQRLFGATSGQRPMRLVRAQVVGDGLTFLTYERARRSRRPVRR